MYEKICKVIELYNKYKGNLNDDGTVATDEQIAEWIVPSVEDHKEPITEEELDKLAVDYENEMYGYAVDLEDEMETDFSGLQNIVDIHDAYKAGCKEMMKKWRDRRGHM